MASKPAFSTGARKLAVGSRVSFHIGSAKMKGRIIEDRGPIGIKGRRLVRVQVIRKASPADQTPTFELPADDLVLAK